MISPECLCLFGRAEISNAYCQGNSEDNHRRLKDLVPDYIQYTSARNEAETGLLSGQITTCSLVKSTLVKKLLLFVQGTNSQNTGSHEFRNEDYNRVHSDLFV